MHCWKCRILYFIRLASLELNPYSTVRSSAIALILNIGRLIKTNRLINKFFKSRRHIEMAVGWLHWKINGCLDNFVWQMLSWALFFPPLDSIHILSSEAITLFCSCSLLVYSLSKGQTGIALFPKEDWLIWWSLGVELVFWLMCSRLHSDFQSFQSVSVLTQTGHREHQEISGALLLSGLECQARWCILDSQLITKVSFTAVAVEMAAAQCV